jgi:hypothetical protein
MPLSVGQTPSPQTNNNEAQFEKMFLEIYPGTNIPKYDKRRITNNYGKNVWVIYEYNPTTRKYDIINNDLSVNANKFLPPPPPSRQNFLPSVNNGSGGVLGGGVEPTQSVGTFNNNSYLDEYIEPSSGENKNNYKDDGHWGGRRSRKSKKSRKSYKKSKKSKKYRKSRRYRR